MKNLIKFNNFKFSNSILKKSRYNIKNLKLNNLNKEESKNNVKTIFSVKKTLMDIQKNISLVTNLFKEKMKILKRNNDYDNISKLYKVYNEELQKYEVQINLLYENELYNKSLDKKYERKIDDLSVNYIIECFPNYFRLDKGFGSEKYAIRNIEVNEEDEDEFVGLENAKTELRHKQLELKASNLFLLLNENDSNTAMDSFYENSYVNNLSKDHLIQPISKEIKDFDKNVQINQNFIEGLEGVIPGTLDSATVYDKESNYLVEEDGVFKKSYHKTEIKKDESLKYNKI